MKDIFHLCNASNISDPIEKTIQKYKNHSSIAIIFAWQLPSVDKNNTFSFVPITADGISQQHKSLDFNRLE